jgi:hypothetical protein
VEVNLAGVTDRAYKASAREQMAEAEREMKTAREVAAGVLAKITGA